MPPSDIEVGVGADMTPTSNPTIVAKNPAEPQYQLTQFEEPFFLVSLIRQIRQRLSEPKITVPREYYQGEARLPVAELQRLSSGSVLTHRISGKTTGSNRHRGLIPCSFTRFW